MEPWTGVQRAFAVKALYKNGDSFMIPQREFRREFGIHRNRAVPSAHAIKTWVVKVSNFSGHYLRNRSTLDIGVLGYIGIV